MLFRSLMLINFCLLRSVGHRIWVKRDLSGTLWILPVISKAEAVWSQQLKSRSKVFSCEHWYCPGCHQCGLQSAPQGMCIAQGDSGGDHHLANFGGCFAIALPLSRVLEEVSCSRLPSSRALALWIHWHFVVLQILAKAAVNLLSS